MKVETEQTFGRFESKQLSRGWIEGRNGVVAGMVDYAHGVAGVYMHHAHRKKSATRAEVLETSLFFCSVGGHLWALPVTCG